MFRRILVPLDGSDLAEEAIGRAAVIARASSCALDLVHVHQPLFELADMRDPTWNEKQILAERGYLDGIASELKSGAGIDVNTCVLHGIAAEAIGVRAKDIRADLIVMSSHGRGGFSRAWIGSVADEVVRRATTPVLVYRPIEGNKDRRALQQPLRHILVPVDGSALSLEILRSAVSLAIVNHASITLLQIVVPVPTITPDIGMPIAYVPGFIDEEATEGLVSAAKHHLDEVARVIFEAGGRVTEKAVVVSSTPAPAIAEYAVSHGMDAIAMATHGRGASRYLLGSVADKVRRIVHLPVLMYGPSRERIHQLQETQRTVTRPEPVAAR